MLLGQENQHGGALTHRPSLPVHAHFHQGERYSNWGRLQNTGWRGRGRGKGSLLRAINNSIKYTETVLSIVGFRHLSLDVNFKFVFCYRFFL